MSLSDKTVEELVSEAEEDEVGLWFIVRIVKDELHAQDSQSIKKATLEGVAQLLQTGKVVAGQYNKLDPTGVERWELDLPAVIDRISREWDQLGREPSLETLLCLSVAGPERPT
jgi:hypothetical protein